MWQRTFSPSLCLHVASSPIPTRSQTRGAATQPVGDNMRPFQRSGLTAVLPPDTHCEDVIYGDACPIRINVLQEAQCFQGGKKGVWASK